MKTITLTDVFFDAFWSEKRVFSKADALVDLYLMADEENSLDIRYRTLAQRWGWSFKKTYGFIGKLEALGVLQITNRNQEGINEESRRNQLTLCVSDNYMVSGINEESRRNQEGIKIKETDKEKVTQKEINKENIKEKYAVAYQKKVKTPVSSQETSSCLPANNKAEEKLNKICEDLKVMWNEIMQPTNIPQCISISTKRKNCIRLRLQEIHKQFPDKSPKEILEVVFRKMARDPWFGGANDRGWKADFGWLFERVDQWLKIYEKPETSTPKQQKHSTARGQVHDGEYDLTTF